MFTSEELENFDIFPKEYSLGCLFKFVLYSLSSIFSFTLLFTFYTDSDLYSVLTMKHLSKNEDVIINDYLTNKLIELSPKDFISENKTNFIQTYDNLKNIFFKEYVMNSYPCLIKNSIEEFGVKEIINIIEENLIKDIDNIILFEYREDPYTQFYDDNYKYFRSSYSNYLNITKNISNNYYFLNEYNIGSNFNNVSGINEQYLKNNYLVNDLTLTNIYLSKVENYVVVWGHMETNDQFLCLKEGNLEFILIPPQEKKYMYPFTRKGPVNYSRVNFFDGKHNINENYPDFFKANKLYINLLAGECLYIPGFWWRSYRTNKKRNIKTTFLTFKYKSNSNYLELLTYVRNDF